MTYIKNLSDRKATRQFVCLFVLFAFFAVPALIVAADDDEDELYVSSYSSKKSRRGGYGITQYQASDEASDYQNTLFSTRREEDYEYGSEYDQDEDFDRDSGYASRRRYSSKNSRPLSSRELEEKYGGSSKSNVDGFVVGSDAFLDAATADVYARRAEQTDTVEATSGLGSKRKSKSSKGLFGFAVETNARDADTFKERWIVPDAPKEVWRSQILPQGLMYQSYLASRKESRLESIINYAEGYGALWDITLGGRAPIWRYGTSDAVLPEGWELELEGAALLRLDWERRRNLAATDYRAGVPLVYGTRRWQFKTGYYHVSSHLGDNYLMDNFRPRVHYSRDSVMLGLAVKPVDDVRLYAEIDYAFHTGETADPVELQFGLEYSPQFNPNMSNWVARPFFATHAHLYQERDFGGYWTTQTGLQWRSATNALMRVGAEYFQGGDDLYQFHTRFQRKYGFGFWFDY